MNSKITAVAPLISFRILIQRRFKNVVDVGNFLHCLAELPTIFLKPIGVVT